MAMDLSAWRCLSNPPSRLDTARDLSRSSRVQLGKRDQARRSLIDRLSSGTGRFELIELSQDVGELEGDAATDCAECGKGGGVERGGGRPVPTMAAPPLTGAVLARTRDDGAGGGSAETTKTSAMASGVPGECPGTVRLGLWVTGCMNDSSE
jgi:hypothetical protein